MFKILIFMRHRSDMSFEEFKRHYEEGHIPLAARLAEEGLSPRLQLYRRNYIRFDDEGTTISPDELDFHCVTEVMFESREKWEAVMRSHDPNSRASELRNADLDKWMEPGSLKFAVVDVHEGYNGHGEYQE